jgi:hypothetical protein
VSINDHTVGVLPGSIFGASAKGITQEKSSANVQSQFGSVPSRLSSGFFLLDVLDFLQVFRGLQ